MRKATARTLVSSPLFGINCASRWLSHNESVPSSDYATPQPSATARILHTSDIGKDLSLVEFLSTETKRDSLSELFFPDQNSRKFSTLADIPVMLPYRWCIELQRSIRETFDEMEFQQKGLLYRAFLHPTFCGLNQQYTADGLLGIGKSVLRYIYSTCLAHSFPDLLTDETTSIERIVRELSKPSVIAQTCTTEWRGLGAMVLTDLGISKLSNVFSPKCWSFNESNTRRAGEPELHYLSKESDPVNFHPELAGLELDESEGAFSNSTPGREKYYAIPFEETLGYAFVGALYFDKGLPATMAFVRRFMLRYAVSSLLESSE